jgi:hypothetical protein
MKATLPEPPPIACTLAAGDFKTRIAWIADLNRDALRGQRRDDLRLELIYDRKAASRVREMVRREQTCCAFLKFQLHEDVESIRLMIDAPQEAREAADVLFEQFQARTGAESECACAPPAKEAGRPPAKTGRTVSVAAAAVATGALACGAFCVIPIALPAIALTSAGGVLAWFAGIHAWITGVAIAAVVGGWDWVWRQSARTKCRPSRSTLYTMGIATVVLALALGWPSIEPYLLRLMVS